MLFSHFKIPKELHDIKLATMKIKGEAHIKFTLLTPLIGDDGR